MSGTKMRISLAIPVGAKLACADHSGAKILNVIAAYRISGVLNRLPTASIGDCILVSVRRGKPELRKKGNHPFSEPNISNFWNIYFWQNSKTP